jgi:(2Fe-2S) ferredoxin
MHLPVPILGAQVVNEEGEWYGTVDHIEIREGIVFLVLSEDEEPDDGAKEPIPFKVVSNDSVL